MAILLLLGSCVPEDPVEVVIRKGQEFLAKIQRPDGAICDTTNPLFDVWETVEAAKALSYQGPPEAMDQAMAFLSSALNAEKLLCHNLKCRKETCVETSAEYLDLLSSIGQRPEPNQIAAMLSRQQPEGYWLVGNPDVRTDTAFPSVTGFAIAAMFPYFEQDSVWQKGGDWLVEQQNAEGHWGKSWEYYGCNAYAIWANVMALRNLKAEKYAEALKRARRYIVDSQLPDGSWDLPIDTKRKISPALQTALMLSSLSKENEEQVEAGSHAVGYLLNSQRADGSWDGGYFPIDNARYEKKEYVFATARAVIALANMRGRRQIEK